MVRPEWHEKAKCKGRSSEFFSDCRGVVKKSLIKICNTCEVQQECLQFALDNFEDYYGVWGGTSPSQRREMRSKAYARDNQAKIKKWEDQVRNLAIVAEYCADMS